MDSFLSIFQDDNTVIKILTVVGSILGAICGILSAVRLFRRYLRARQRKQEAEENRTLEKAIEILRAAFLDNLQSVKKLTTIETIIEGCIPLKKQRKILILNVGTNELTLTYKGKITCGCDLQHIRFEPNENISGGVKILAPHCRIIEAFVDISSIEIHYEKKPNFLAPEITLEEQNLIINADFEKQKQSKLDAGILKFADDKVKEMLLQISDNKKISVEVIFLGEDTNLPQLNPPVENSERIDA